MSISESMISLPNMKNEMRNPDYIKEDVDVESLPLKEPIISYGADYTLDSIRQYVADRQIVVQPSFQREFVWDIKKSSKLIESFLLGYPVPNILLGRNPETETMEVIDGQQRILSIYDYFIGTFRGEKIFKLTGEDIDSRFREKSFGDLDEATQKKLRNSVLKAVVMVYPKTDPNIKFTVFQRINTGSIVLNQQEIRNCIYGGNFNEMLIKLNKENAQWRKLVGRKPDKRMKDVETLLRFFAAYEMSDKYEKPLTGFLNVFMDAHKDATVTVTENWTYLFNNTLELLVEHIGVKDFPKSKGSNTFNRAVFESVMTAVARLESEGKLDLPGLKMKYLTLISNELFVEAVTSNTSDKKVYKDRMRMSYEMLA